MPSYSGITITWKVLDKSGNDLTGVTIDNPELSFADGEDDKIIILTADTTAIDGVLVGTLSGPAAAAYKFVNNNVEFQLDIAKDTTGPSLFDFTVEKVKRKTAKL